MQLKNVQVLEAKKRRTNDESDVATDVNAFDVVKFVKVLNAKKNWRGLT